MHVGLADLIVGPTCISFTLVHYSDHIYHLDVYWRWTFGMQSTFPYMYFSVIFQLTEWQSSVLCYLVNFISFLIVNQNLILCRQYPNQIIKLTSQGIFRNSRKSVNHCQQGLQNWFTSANISPQAPANLTLFSKSE